MIRALPLYLAVMMGASSAAAQDAPLGQIPAKAPVVIGIRGLKRTTERCLAMVKAALPDQAGAVQAFLENLMKRSQIGGRPLQGLKEDGPIFLVLQSLPRLDKLEMPSFGLLARVTDYKAFRDGLLTAEERKSLSEDKTNGWEVAALAAGQVFFIPRKDYAVVCLSQQAAAGFAKKEQGQGFAGTLPRQLGAKLLDSDLALYVDLAAVNKEYEQIIKAGKLALGGLIDPGGEEGGKLDQGQTEMIRGIYSALLQAADDSTYLFLSCDFRPQGLACHLSVGVAENSKTNQLLKTMKPSPLASLQALPAGFTTYTAVDFGPEAYKAFHPIMKNLLAAAGEKGDQASEKAVADALDDLLDARPRELYSAARMGVARGSLQIWQYADPDKGDAAQLRMFKALKEGTSFQFIPLKGKAGVKTAVQPYRNVKLHSVLLKWDLEKLADSLLGSEDGSAMLKKFSGEGTTLWFGNVDKRSVQVQAADWKTASDYLDKYFKKEGVVGAGDKAFLEARSNLPKEATLVTLIHVPQYGQYLAELLHEAIRTQGAKRVKAPVAGAKPPDSYLGIAVTLQPGTASFDLWLPGAAVSEFSRILEPVLK
jgi:hypothetical protein